MVAFKHGNNQKISTSFSLKPFGALRRVTAMSALLAMSFSASALIAPQPNGQVQTKPNALSATVLPNQLSALSESAFDEWVWWKTVGSASLTWGFWKVYDSELRTPSGTFVSDNELPLALVITYSRDIDADDLLDATVEQWEHLGFTSQQIAQWLPQMKGAWPDVKEGDRLIYTLKAEGGQFVYQPVQGDMQPFATLKDKTLAKAFSDIWLSPKTEYPSLRLGLIGRN